MDQQNCPLLDLPAELRNLIYSFCQDGSVVTSKHDPNYAKSNFRALTQVCQQIRQEFRPVYMEDTNIEVDWPEDLDSYLEAFYPIMEQKVMETYRGDFFITIPHRFVDEDIDLTLLLKLQAMAPRIHFYIEDELSVEGSPVFIDAYSDQLNELLQHTKDPSNQTWHHILTSEMISIFFHCDGETPELFFQTNKEMALKAEDWWAEAGLPTLDYFSREFWWGEGVYGPREGLRKGCVKWYKGFSPF